MRVAWFGFFGTPAKLLLDEDDLPEGCESYDSATDSFVARDELAPDLWDEHGPPADRRSRVQRAA